MVEGTAYEIDPDLAGETVLLLWGLFDNELHVEFDGERTGPYYPVSGPIPLNRYRAFRKGAVSQKAERIRNLIYSTKPVIREMHSISTSHTAIKH